MADLLNMFGKKGDKLLIDTEIVNVVDSGQGLELTFAGRIRLQSGSEEEVSPLFTITVKTREP